MSDFMTPYGSKVTIRAVASPTHPGWQKHSGGAKYLSSILKFEVKNRHKSAKESKTTFAVCCSCVVM